MAANGTWPLVRAASYFGGWIMARWIGLSLHGFRVCQRVVRNARTFPRRPDVFGTVRSLHPTETLSRAGRCSRAVSSCASAWGSRRGGAPAGRNWSPTRRASRRAFPPRRRRGQPFDRRDEELDILFTAGGDRLWKLLNLTRGGAYGLSQFDYFQNRYFADVPYRIADCGLDVWLRLVPQAHGRQGLGGNVDADRPRNAETREEGLTVAASGGAVLVIEAQPTGDPGASFVPFATVRFEREIEIDQEALHFQPFAGRGFEPYGFFTTLRKKVYPASAHARPANRGEREARTAEGSSSACFMGRAKRASTRPAARPRGG